MSKKFYDTGGKNFSEILPEIKVIEQPGEFGNPDGIAEQCERVSQQQ